MKLLHIDSGIFDEQSVNRQLSASIVAHLKEIIPDLDITHRDVARAPVPQLSPALWDRLTKGEASQTSAQETIEPGEQATAPKFEQDFATVKAVLHEFLAADIIVVGVPMYNFGIPSRLKAWIDWLIIPGTTFHYTAQGTKEGLYGEKRVIVASSRGDIYSGAPPVADSDHQERYLSTIFNFLGVTNLTFVRAEGVKLGAELRQRGLSTVQAKVAALRVPQRQEPPAYERVYSIA